MTINGLQFAALTAAGDIKGSSPSAEPEVCATHKGFCVIDAVVRASCWVGWDKVRVVESERRARCDVCNI